MLNILADMLDIIIIVNNSIGKMLNMIANIISK